MKNQADYSQYECPYAHIDKECGHELQGPEGFEDTYGVWCACGFRGPVFCLEPEDLRLIPRSEILKCCPFCGDSAELRDDGDFTVMEGVKNWWVACNTCEAFMGGFWTAEEAVEEWNLRKPEPAQSTLKEPEQEFTTPSPELNNLLNTVYGIAANGGGHDDLMMFSNDLDAVLALIKPEPEQEWENGVPPRGIRLEHYKTNKWEPCRYIGYLACERLHIVEGDGWWNAFDELDRLRPIDPRTPRDRAIKLGDRVTKVSCPSWTGHVVGYFNTKLTPNGVCVESENEPGSVQIYPVQALRLLS